jgi:putative transposase
MKHIDEIYTKRPFYGSRRIRDALVDDYRTTIARDHVRRLMRVMGLEAVYPKKNTSKPHPEHLKYPYLLRYLRLVRPDQVWGTDITYVRLEDGWAYLTAILDWYSRYILAWRLSPTLTVDFCLETLEAALLTSIPEIHNSDQGVQYTSQDYTDILKDHEIQISMDGRGRCFDNIFTERLWRTVKYEDIYLKSYRNLAEAQQGLTEYFDFYNNERRHQSLDRMTPADVYFNSK